MDKDNVSQISKLTMIEKSDSYVALSWELAKFLDKDKRLGLRAKQVWSFLYRHSKFDSNKHTRQVSFSTRQISEACGCSRTPVHFAIIELEKYGYLSKKANFAQDGARLKNTYAVLFPCDGLNIIEKHVATKNIKRACFKTNNINNIKTLSNLKNNIVEAECDVELSEPQDNPVDLEIKNQSQDESHEMNAPQTEDVLSHCLPANVLEKIADTKSKYEQCERLIESGKIKTVTSLPEDLKQSFTLWKPYRNSSISSAYRAFAGCVNKALEIGEIVGGITLQAAFNEAKTGSKIKGQELISMLTEACLNICHHKIVLPEYTFAVKGKRPSIEAEKAPELSLGKSKSFTDELKRFVGSRKNASYIKAKYPEATSSMDELTRLAAEDKELSQAIHQLNPDQRAQIVGRLKKLSNAGQLPSQYTADWSLFREVAFYAKYCFKPKDKSFDETGRIRYGVNVAIKMIKDGVWGTPRPIAQVGTRIRELLSQLEKIIFNSAQNRKNGSWISNLGLCGA